MADTVRFSVTCQPIEDVGASQQGSVSHYIAASECFTGGGAGEVAGSSDALTAVTIDSTGGNNDGYLNGSPFYISAAAAAESAASLITDLAAVGFVYFKHTGFEYSSSSALSNTANTADVLCIQTNSASNERVTFARLEAGEAIVLPVRKGCTLNEFAVCSSDGANLDATTGANTIGVEFMAFAVTGP